MAELPLLFAVGDYQARRLNSERDEALVQAFHEQCADYIAVVEGRAPNEDAGREFFRAAPDGWRPEDVDKIGVFRPAERLVGLVESVQGYPEPDVMYLGLMLLEPSVRGGGVGSRLYQEFEEWAADHGVRQIRLSVVEDNEPAHRFWRHLGFADINVTPPQVMGDKVQRVFVMARSIPSGK